MCAEKKKRSPRGTIQISTNRGKLRLVWTCPIEGRRKYLYTQWVDSPINRKFADQKAALIELEMRSGVYTGDLSRYKNKKKKGFDVAAVDLFERWIASKRHAVTERTLKKYQVTKSQFQDYFGGVVAEDIKEQEIWRWRQALLGSGIGEAQIKRRIEELRACWNWAIEEKELNTTENPWNKVYRSIKVPPQRKPNPFTREEIGAILQEFRTNPDLQQYAALVETLFDTGCRFGEAVGLRWGSISEACDRIWIGEIMTRGERRPTKGNKSREIVLGYRLQTLYKLMIRGGSDDLVFTSSGGAAIDDHNFSSRIWKPLLNRLEIEYRSLKNTRHTFVSHALSLGVPPMQIAAITGHSERVLFKNYAAQITTQSQSPNLLDQIVENK